MTYSDREREFTFAKKVRFLVHSVFMQPTVYHEQVAWIRRRSHRPQQLRMRGGGTSLASTPSTGTELG